MPLADLGRSGQGSGKATGPDHCADNAGGAWPRRQLTVDGHEMNFGVNHLAPFLLTRLLLEKLKSNPQARIVNVSSAAHRFGTIDVDDLTAANDYGGYRMYARSKLMNLLFTFELARQLAETGVKVNAVHPGWVATNISHNFGWQGTLWWLVSKLVGRSPEQGARTLIYLASSPDLQVSGQYFARERPIVPSAAALDEEVGRRMWKISMEMTDKWTRG
jgi:NAD(P)-dependent dehydrogenase (short-subunit alcohol dehydrogenase family)